MSIGNSNLRLDAMAKAMGKSLYAGDFNNPNQLYLKLLFSKYPHAVIHAVHTEKAKALEGVIAVFTSKDVPVNEYGLGIKDQPVLCGPGSEKPYTDRVRFIGDQIAVVAAESEEIAANAVKLIEVEYEPLPIITDPHTALESGSTLLHPDRGSNVIHSYRIRKGDLQKGFEEADIVVESSYETPVQEHAFLQPEAGVAYMDEENRVTVVAAGQWAHEEQEQIAHALSLPMDKVRVIQPAIGGAFGGREDISIQIVLALAAYRLAQRGIHRPVKLVWSREESMFGHGKRHPYYMHTRWGAKRDGTLVAAEVNLVADGGAYCYTSPKVLGNATLMCTGPYAIPNVHVDSCVVYTNNLPNGAFRGFGGPQGAYLAEMQMNKLAELLEMDPVEIRMKNLLDEEKTISMNSKLPKGVSIREVLKDCAEASGWKLVDGAWKQVEEISQPDPKKPYLRRGRGIACAYKNVGFSFGAPESCTAMVELHGQTEIDYAVVHHAGSDVGQGAHTVFAQIAAETLNLPIEKIRLVTGDTAFTPNSGSASASRMTFMAGNSIIGAAREALARWEQEDRPAIATFVYRPPATTPMNKETGEAMPNFSYGYVAEAVDLEVDVETGEIHLLKVTCSDDVGKAINPQQVVGQIEGAVVQAGGYAILENFIQRDGKVVTDKLSTYLIPTVLDIPDQVESRVMEIKDPIGPYGARGMGEMPYLPLVPAIADALHQATGVWFNRFPFTPELVSSTLQPF